MILRLAWRNVVRHRRRSMQSAFSIGIAVMLAIAARGLTAGLENVAGEQVALGQYGAVLIHKRGFTANVKAELLSFAFPYDEAWLGTIRAVPGVVAAAPRLGYSAIVNLGDTSIASPMLGFDPVAELAVCPLKELPRGLSGAALSSLLTRDLGAQLGQELVLLSADHDGVLNAEAAPVAGFLRSVPLLMPNKRLVLVPLSIAQALLRLPGQALEIAVGIDDYQHPEATARALRAALGPTFEVHTWKDSARSLMETMRQRSVVMAFITNIILVLALVGVGNTLLLSVHGRTQEIGTMMAFGVRRRRIAGLFVTEAILLGLGSALLGAVLGAALIAISGFVGIPLKVPGAEVTFVLRPMMSMDAALRVVLSVLAGAVAATLYPAWRASRLSPLEALSS